MKLLTHENWQVNDSYDLYRAQRILPIFRFIDCSNKLALRLLMYNSASIITFVNFSLVFYTDI